MIDRWGPTLGSFGLFCFMQLSQRMQHPAGIPGEITWYRLFLGGDRRCILIFIPDERPHTYVAGGAGGH